MTKNVLILLLITPVFSFLTSCSSTDVSLQSSTAALTFVDNDKLQNDPSFIEYKAYKKLFSDTDPYQYPHTYHMLLKHPNWVLRYGAAKAIGWYTYDTSDTKLFKERLLDIALHDSVLDVRGEALYALSNMSTQSDCPLYVKLYTTEPENKPVAKESYAPRDYKNTIADALKELNCPEAKKLLAPKDMNIASIMQILHKENQDSNYYTLTDQGKEAVEIFLRKNIDDIFNETVQYINDSNGYVRSLIVHTLGYSKKAEAYPLIVNKLHNDPLAFVRFDAIMSLKHYKDQRACGELRKFIEGNDFGDLSPGFGVRELKIPAFDTIHDLGCSTTGIPNPDPRFQ